MNPYEYDSLLARPIMAKVPELLRHERLKHVLFAQQFDRELLEYLGEIATRISQLSQYKNGSQFLGDLLPHKRAMLYFTQVSTRTFLSFMAACQVLGMTCNEIRDPRVSSEYKGEHPLDSVRMFSSYFDVIIMRSGEPSFAERCAYLMNDLERSQQRSVPIVNAGSGADEHPTQALLDIYTIQKAFEFNSNQDSARWTRFDDLRRRHPGLTKGLDNKTYCFCGDVGRGRTVRSLALLLSLYKDVTMYFVAPEHEKLKLSPDLRRRLTEAGVTVHESDNLAETLPKVDLLYMTRIQHEHNSSADAAAFSELGMERFRLTPEMLLLLKEYAPILHPFPRNEEIPFEIDTDPRALYFQQARNGMWIRAALLAYVFDVEGKITSHHRREFADVHDYNVKAL